MIKAEVAYATLSQQIILVVLVTEGTTIKEAIQQSNICQLFPEIDLNKQRVGLFGKVQALSMIVQDGDRIEIYRPLIIDPKEARRAKGRLRKKR